ncbi:ERC protein 2-like isoform X2 [Mytilus edulis]|uniref:ERC protein 2-like isoform X2 n=1 Tax=Mytilus edulis TaxID=6550 RepID=UPI0039F10E0E
MTTEESSNSSDWALVTNEGEIESEDDACSESSIELLTSEDEGDSSSQRSSDTGTDPSRPFFVLRLRSKDLLTESDSDDKDESAKNVTKHEKGSTVPCAAIQGEVTKHEKGSTVPCAAIQGEVTKHEKGSTVPCAAIQGEVTKQKKGSTVPCAAIQGEVTNQEKGSTVPLTAIQGKMASTTDGAEGSQKLLNNTESKKSEGDEIKPITFEMERKGSNSGSEVENNEPASSVNSDIKDDISFPSTSGHSSSDESIPEVLHLVAHISDSGESCSDFKIKEKENMGRKENSEKHTEEDAGETDTRSDRSQETNSLQSSNFSLMDHEDNENEARNEIEAEGQSDPQSDQTDSANEDDTFTLLERDTEGLVHRSGHRYMENGDDLIQETVFRNEEDDTQLQRTPEVTVRQPKLEKTDGLIIMIVEIICILVASTAAYWAGYSQGVGNHSVCCSDLLKSTRRVEMLTANGMEQTRKDIELLKNTTQTSVNLLWDDFEQKGLSTDQLVKDKTDWKYKDMGYNVDKFSDIRFQKLDNELKSHIYRFGNLLQHHVTKFRAENGHQRYHNSKLEQKQNELKNDNADLKKELIEYGKRKYLISELEDENLALIKRISDIENQLLSAEDQMYVLQLKVSQYERKKELKHSSEYNVEVDTTDLSVIAQLKEENNKLQDSIIDLENKIAGLDADGRQKDNYLHESNRYKEENRDLMKERGQLQTEVDRLKNQLKESKNYAFELEIKLKELEKAADEQEKRSQEEIEKMKTENVKFRNKKKEDFKKDKNDNEHAHTKKKRSSSDNDGGYKSWSDAMNDILNKTRSSMVTVNKQIQETLTQVKNLSGDLWKKHEPKVNHILASTYETVKKNVNNVSKNVVKAAAKIVQKSAKWIRKYKKSRKNKHNRNQNDDSDQDGFTASTSRRKYEDGSGNNKQSDDDKQSYDHYEKHSYDSDQRGPNTHGSIHLKTELENLFESVEYVSTRNDLSCGQIIDIMEDFQHFKMNEGINVLSDEEKSWFYCQKAWFENMAYSDPNVDTECREKLGRRQLAAADHGCCPCLYKHGRSQGKFCNLNNGCSHLNPKEKKPINKRRDQKKSKQQEGTKDYTSDEKTVQNKTEEDLTKNHGDFSYCDPFSQDLDCGDESWYLKRMTDREHLRKYRESSKTDWVFHRAEERDYHRTQPDSWYFNKYGGGQAYEPHHDDMVYKDMDLDKESHEDNEHEEDDGHVEDDEHEEDIDYGHNKFSYEDL